jgi:hypothetical protein
MYKLWNVINLRSLKKIMILRHTVYAMPIYNSFTCITFHKITLGRLCDSSYKSTYDSVHKLHKVHTLHRMGLGNSIIETNYISLTS